MALFINTYWRLQLTNSLVHPQWVFAVNLKDLSCLWHRKDDPTRILVSFCRDDRWQRQTEDASRGHRYRCHQPDPLCPQPFPSCYCLNVCFPPVAVQTLLWQMPWPKATLGRKGLFDLQSQIPVHHFREVKSGIYTAVTYMSSQECTHAACLPFPSSFLLSYIVQDLPMV